jgi:acyl carrier protein
LIALIRDEFDYAAPQDSVNVQNFRTVGQLSEMISGASN